MLKEVQLLGDSHVKISWMLVENVKKKYPLGTAILLYGRGLKCFFNLAYV